MYICIYKIYIIYACKCVYKCIYIICVYTYIVSMKLYVQGKAITLGAMFRQYSYKAATLSAKSIHSCFIVFPVFPMCVYISYVILWLHTYTYHICDHDYIYIHNVNFILLTFQGSGAGRQPLMSWRRCNRFMIGKAVEFRNSIPKYPKCPLGMFDCQILFDSVKEMPQNVQYHEDWGLSIHCDRVTFSSICLSSRLINFRHEILADISARGSWNSAVSLLFQRHKAI